MKQDKALAILKSGKNVFLTGSAGAGKTYVLNQYITFLKERKVAVAITASTGIAATHMNGMTIHSWAGFGIKDRLTRANLVTMRTKKYLKKHLEEAQILIIDEISMLHKNQLEMVDQVLTYFQEDDRAFGGIQVVVCGDFFQLPPIGNYSEKSKDKFAFMAKAWVDAKFNVCYLTEQYRQENNNVLNIILNEIRTRTITHTSIQKLKEAETNSLNEVETPTKLFTHNADVDAINEMELSKLQDRSKKFKASTKGNKKLIETLKKSVLAHEMLELKKDAKVMFVRNSQEQDYVNGTLGVIEDFDDGGYPIVKTINGKRIYVKRETWSVQDDHGKELASLEQIPLRLAWAITVHKCQGMTLDSAMIDLSKTFEKGQGYVALSRLKNIENLHLSGFNEMALQVDGLAYKADVRFKELSELVDKEYDFKTLEVASKLFVKECGGLTDADEIEKYKKQKKDKKSKQSTYEITLSYLRKEMSLDEIAEARGLSDGTIASHIIRIKKDNPKEDLDYYKPPSDLMQKVIKARNTLDVDQINGLKAIHTALKGEVEFNDIKMVLAFLD